MGRPAGTVLGSTWPKVNATGIMLLPEGIDPALLLPNAPTPGSCTIPPAGRHPCWAALNATVLRPSEHTCLRAGFHMYALRHFAAYAESRLL